MALRELQQKHTSAKTVCRDRKNLMSVIQKPDHDLPVPPQTKHGANGRAGAGGSAAAASEVIQLAHWTRLLAYERTNPERLDGPALKNRVRSAYKHWLCACRHHPEAWHEFAAYEDETGDAAAACAVYRNALAVESLRHCELLAWLAELEERLGHVDEARAVYERLVQEAPSRPGSSGRRRARK